MNNRGISPLIATIFLIAVAVALGSIVMSLGQDYVTQAGGLPESSCSALSYSVKTVKYTTADNSVLVTIDNQGVAIDGFLLKFFNNDYTQGYTQQVSQQLAPFDVGIVKTIVNSDEVERVYEVTLIPLELSGNELLTCSDSSVTITQTNPRFVVE